MVYITSAYKKSIKIIESCTNQAHTKAARNYVNNFFKLYSDTSDRKYGPFEVFYASSMLDKMYKRLLHKLRIVEKKFS